MTSEIISKQSLPPTVPQEQYELVKEQFAKGCTDNEFQVFIELANRYGLDPFARQIWAVKGYGNAPAQIMVARDGYLAIAHRSGQFDGMSDPEYETDDKGKVTHVRIRVYRKDMQHPFVGDAWDDEDNLRQSVWNKRPRTMLLKVAESRALRKAFSVSGTYCPEEMGYEEQPVKITPRPTDINVDAVPVEQPSTNSPKPEPVKAPEKHTCKIYTVDEINTKLIPIYQQQKLNLAIFAEADLGDGTYNRDLIDADYKKQITRPASEVPAPKKEASSLEEFKAEVVKDATEKVAKSKQTKPSATLSGETCEKCGKKLLKKDIDACNMFCKGHLFCEDCMKEYVSSKVSSKIGGSQ